MTLTRRIAVWLLDWVERHTPPHSQAWARAARAEMDHIPGDWQALRWALGSVRLFFARTAKSQTLQGANLSTLQLAELSAETSRMMDRVDSMRRYMGMWTLICVAGSTVTLVLPHIFHWHMKREDPYIGIIHLLAGFTCFLLWLKARRIHLDDLGLETDAHSEIQQYKAALDAQNSTGAGWQVTLLMAFITQQAFGLGVIEHPAGLIKKMALYAIYIVIFAVTCVSLFERRRKYKQRLAALQELIEKSRDI